MATVVSLIIGTLRLEITLVPKLYADGGGISRVAVGRAATVTSSDSSLGLRLLLAVGGAARTPNRVAVRVHEADA